MSKERKDRQVRQLFGGAGAVAVISLAATAVLAVAGFPPLEDTGPTPPAPEAAATAVSWTQTPAATTLASVLENPPPGWKTDGDLQRAVVAPLPYSCPVQNSAASTSLARSFTVDGTRMRVTVQAYTAGLGAEALSQMYSSAPTCAGAEGAVASSPIYGDSPGQDGQVASVSHGGQRSSVASFRLGDVVAFVTGSNAQALINAAVDLDEVLEGALKGVCANTASSAADASRSPFSLAGYKTFTEPESVSIPAVPLPSTTKESGTASPSAAPAPSPAARPGLTAYPVPSPELVSNTAEPMDEPTFPVWPAMPKPVSLPQAPESPAAAATTKKTFRVPANDATGPGCGWSFTGLKAPGFDAGAAEASKEKQSEEAMASLVAGAKTWQSDVLTYWESYAEYEKKASAYNKYAEKVAETNRAWAATAVKWEEYWAEMDQFNSRQAARDDFLERQESARSEYETQLKVCAAPQPKPTEAPEAPEEEAEPTPTDSPSATPSPSPSPTATEDPAPEPREGCPAEKPAILSETAPAVPDMPREPEDPRP